MEFSLRLSSTLPAGKPIDQSMADAALPSVVAAALSNLTSAGAAAAESAAPLRKFLREFIVIPS